VYKFNTIWSSDTLDFQNYISGIFVCLFSYRLKLFVVKAVCSIFMRLSWPHPDGQEIAMSDDTAHLVFRCFVWGGCVSGAR
jgi:hypothetical protein